jgi:hypothetical protein
MDIFRPFRRKKFIDNFVLLFKEQNKKQLQEDDAQHYKKWVIAFLTKNFERYERDVYNNAVVPDYWRKRIVEHTVDEYILEHNVLSTLDVDVFVRKILDRYDIVVEMWLDIDNKLKGDD